MIVSVPVLGPTPCGLNVTLIVQVCWASSTFGQADWAEKSTPVIEKPEKCKLVV